MSTELLYDKPYQDTKRIRVSIPFAVESLSPHRPRGVSQTTRTSKPTHSQEPRHRFKF